MTIEYRLPPDLVMPTESQIQSTLGQVVDWSHGLIGVPEAWKSSRGKGVLVAVLDTGCDLSHPDLVSQIEDHKDFTGKGTAQDGHGHGTHCCGIVAAIDNQIGVVGIAPEARLLVGKVLSDGGSGNDDEIAAGIDWATAKGAAIISMSLGSRSPSSRIKAACDRAIARNVIIIAAAGNDGPGEDTTGYPGGFPGVVSVGAVGSDGRLTSFSSRGKVDVAAPGANIVSCLPGGRYGPMSGTSMACPIVAGASALPLSYADSIRQIRPGHQSMIAMLRGSSLDKGPTGKDSGFGWGLINPRYLLGEVDPLPPTKG